MCFKRNHLKFRNKTFSFIEDYSHNVIVDLLHDKGLAFCYALISNDKIRQSDDNYKKIQNSVSRKYQLFFLAFIDYT